MAAVCQGALRQVDRLSRVGGEEFVALLPGSSAADAMLVAERLRVEVSALALDELAPGLTITISLGVTELRPSDRSLDQLLRRADRALYEAKKQGRNRVEQLLD
jgi:diguanylate cyclase (GGDEF)-like protein